MAGNVQIRCALVTLGLLAGCEGFLWRAGGGPPPPPPEVDAGMPVPGFDAGEPPVQFDAGRTIEPPPVGARSEASVFFIGHSLINHDMPAMLAGLAASAGVTHDYDSHIGNGASLSWIWNNPTTGEGLNPRTALPTGSYDTIVMTEAIPLADQMQYNDTDGYAGNFYDLAMTGDSSAQTYFYETWHSLDGAYDWRARLTSDRALWESVIDQVNAAKSGPDMLLIPAGTAMARLVDRIESGGVPGMSSRRDLFLDDIHLNDVGNYFIACVQFAAIYRRSPVGLTRTTVDRFGGAFTAPSADVARIMQEIAWDVVSNDPRAGVR